jgi:heat shock protein HslJ
VNHGRGHAVIKEDGVYERRWAMTAKRLALVLAMTAVVASVVAFAAGCGSDDGSGGDGGASTSAAALEGASWRLTGWSVSSKDPNDFTITAEFTDGRIGGTSAVNQYGGPYTADDDGSFSVGELVSTMMAGPEPDMEAEQVYLELLAQVDRFAIDGDELTLSAGSGNIALIYTRSAASPGG